ncbi:hypothetical protein [Actinophytocola gossypii]|uniref:Secreted protein n=1 Tax=Actinophytocola gossypii TaxID=2812003 RepID=A0ABT2JC56_9PSEU|nr:hypothetical protein [Actinophytocola gossypii]MCT2585425.1 hypothetical protein [Actinophytocola gossypii]
MEVGGPGWCRGVAVAVLVAVLGVFGLGTSAHVETPDRPGHGAVVLAVAAPAPGVAQPPGAPDLPLADDEPAPAREHLTVEVRADDIHQPAHPRAAQRPAAGRAPPG